MKKAILVVSFGTTYKEALMLNIESVESKIREAFPEYEVRRAFTSRMVIKRLSERDGIQTDTEQQALERLQSEGYKEVFIQPLHVVAGEEYEKIKSIVLQYSHAEDKPFNIIALGRPLLYYMGQEGQTDDYLAAIEAIKNQLPVFKDKEAIVFMGHGGTHPANTAYAALQMKFEQAGLNSVFIYTVEGFPELNGVIEKLKKNEVKKVILMPFMLVAGDHAYNDMAGDEDDSAKTQLANAGIKADVYLHGLGENVAIQEIYVQHLRDAMEK